MKRRLSGAQILCIALFVIACSFGMAMRQNEREYPWTPRAQYNDATPLGGKGLRLLLARLGYNVRLQSGSLRAMPPDAGAWLLLDPGAYFSRREAQDLWSWVNRGGTLIWADTPDWQRRQIDPMAGDSASNNFLRQKIGIIDGGDANTPRPRAGQLLPDLVPIQSGVPNIYWSGVKNASTSGWPLSTKGNDLEIASSAVGPQLVRINVGKGRVFLLPDPLLFTNYALSKGDNAILATNLLGVHLDPKNTIYFDERQIRDGSSPKVLPPSLITYLWRPPLRWALLQLFVAGLLAWALYGRRLGSPVPIPDTDPVTRASQFALAMGQLFQKAQRPQAAAKTVGEEFRRTLARRVGLSPQDNDAAIVERAALATGLPAALLDRLLLRARTPREHEADILSDAQEMDMVLRHLDAPSRRDISR
jgi:hypothetical protein